MNIIILIKKLFVKKMDNNRGKNPRGEDGRFISRIPKKQDNTYSELYGEWSKVLTDKLVTYPSGARWTGDLPQSLTINGVTYVKEEV